MTRNDFVTVQVLNRADISLKTNLDCHLCMKISYLRLVLIYMSNQSSTYFSSDTKIKTCFTQITQFEFYKIPKCISRIMKGYSYVQRLKFKAYVMEV